MTSTIQ